MAAAVANRYARALVDVVTASTSTVQPEVAVQQLRAVGEMLAGSLELRTALLTPAIPNSRKRAVIGRLLEEMSVSDLIRNFVYVIINHRRIGLLGEISEAFELLMDQRLGFVRAEVTSASALDARRSASIVIVVESQLEPGSCARDEGIDVVLFSLYGAGDGVAHAVVDIQLSCGLEVVLNPEIFW